MDSNALSALNAYRSQLKLMDGVNASPAQEESNNTSFLQLMKQAVKEATNTEYTSEATQMQSLSGKVELTDLVTAVTNAELTLDTVVAIRDRVINAYQDIIKLSI